MRNTEFQLSVVFQHKIHYLVVFWFCTKVSFENNYFMFSMCSKSPGQTGSSNNTVRLPFAAFI